ncbi:uncharacterized protein C8R40DRAFT_1164277 [Lentinula edodes]|uniref:uncharacterized protein n=1 Tax=Lentinula edodes TaxID=5353 RepID=UPI001E8EAD5A|nr:uncharacterized protein C8R40DRAFT_1164277 [Lentinula edodes]KAH7880842.1 hypothetical protein C8R40DRAFT_1164277 [Lentinula edodes]
MVQNRKLKAATSEQLEARRIINAKHYAQNREKITAHRRKKYQDDMAKAALKEYQESKRIKKKRKAALKEAEQKLKESYLRIRNREIKKKAVTHESPLEDDDPCELSPTRPTTHEKSAISVKVNYSKTRQDASIPPHARRVKDKQLTPTKRKRSPAITDSDEFNPHHLPLRTKECETSRSIPMTSPLVRTSSLPPSSVPSSPISRIVDHSRHESSSNFTPLMPFIVTRLNFSLAEARGIYAKFKLLCGESRSKFFKPLYDDFLVTHELEKADAMETEIKLLCSTMEIRREQINTYAKPCDEDVVDEVLGYICELAAWKEDIEDFNHFAFLGKDTLRDELEPETGTIHRLLKT